MYIQVDIFVVRFGQKCVCERVWMRPCARVRVCARARVRAFVFAWIRASETTTIRVSVNSSLVRRILTEIQMLVVFGKGRDPDLGFHLGLLLALFVDSPGE